MGKRKEKKKNLCKFCRDSTSLHKICILHITQNIVVSTITVNMCQNCAEKYFDNILAEVQSDGCRVS